LAERAIVPLLSSREKILEAARQLFATKGFAETSVDEIAELAGVAKGTIYTHFSSKDEILVTILRVGNTELTERMEHLMKEDLPYPNRLKNVCKAILEYLDHHYHFHRVYSIQRQMMPMPECQSEAFRQELFQQFFNSHKVLTRYIQEGIDGGYFRQIPADVIAAYFPVILSHGLFINDVFQNNASVDELAEAAYDIFMRGFGTASKEA
jgi:TetR/AcrR family transcriptional regulator